MPWTVLAHAGHWTADFVFVAPLIVLGVLVAVEQLRRRGRVSPPRRRR